MQQNLLRASWVLGLILSLLLAMPLRVWGQKPGISLGRTELAPGQMFSITLTTPDEIETPPSFPKIEGMPSQGSSSSSSTTIVNGQVSSTYSITQRYLAKAEGRHVLKPFELVVGGKTYKHPGATIIVKKGAADEPDPANQFDPFEEFFGTRRNATYKEVKEKAFLALDADKESVWVGQGFTLTLSLYVAEDNRADLEFYDLNGQISTITKQIKPTNCWEENFGITNIEPRSVVLNGKNYMEYRIWQSAFYPLDAKPLQFPRIGLKLIKYQMAADPFFGGLDRRQTLKTFYTQPFTLKVKEVPPSPYGRTLPVGDYKLVERIGRSRVETGQSVSYQFIIKGEGNIAGLEMPVPAASAEMDVYPPTVQQNILRDAGRVTGSKTFTYLLQPKQEGRYPLAGRGFVFPFFNSRTGRYDSLRSQITLTSFGQVKQTSENSPDEGDYLSNRLVYMDTDEGLKVVGNIILLLLAVALGIGLVWKGGKAKN